MLSTVIFGLTLSLLAVAQPTIAEENVCDDDCKDMGFKVENTTAVNWFEAQQFCAAEGLTLVSINSEFKNERLLKYLSATNYTQLTVENNHSVFWTSGTRQGDDKTWVFLSNAIRASYTNWREKEPNNLGGNEKCLSYHTDGTWNDSTCSEKKKYPICESRWSSHHSLK